MRVGLPTSHLALVLDCMIRRACLQDITYRAQHKFTDITNAKAPLPLCYEQGRVQESIENMQHIGFKGDRRHSALQK